MLELVSFTARAVDTALADFAVTWLFAWVLLAFLTMLYFPTRNYLSLILFALVLSFCVTVAFSGLAAMLGGV